MTDTTDVASATDTQSQQAPVESAKTELKSTDTSVLKPLISDTATPSQSDASSKSEKPDTDASPADKRADADSSEAEHQDDDQYDREGRKIEPWMRKRLQRAEERGRKLARAEILDEIRTLRAAPPESARAESQGQEQQTAQKTLADFDYDIEKYNAYMIREGVKQALAERDAEQERQRQERAAEEARNAFEKRKAEFEKRVGDGAWEEMVSAKVDVPQEVIDLLMGHPKDLDIAYYLVRHADELDKLRGKSKLEIARGLASIESKLSGSNAEELPPKTTQAPPPPPKVTGAGKSVKSIAEMSTAERIAEWRRQRQQRRQA